MSLTKIEITEFLIEHYQLNKPETKQIVESFFEEIRQCLEAGQDVKLSGFGNFELRNKASPPRP